MGEIKSLLRDVYESYMQLEKAYDGLEKENDRLLRAVVDIKSIFNINILEFEKVPCFEEVVEILKELEQ